MAINSSAIAVKERKKIQRSFFLGGILSGRENYAFFSRAPLFVKRIFK
jgi:hypothetical protein